MRTAEAACAGVAEGVRAAALGLLEERAGGAWEAALRATAAAEQATAGAEAARAGAGAGREAWAGPGEGRCAGRAMVPRLR